MKKTILTTLIGISLFLSGCAQQNPVGNQNLNINQPAANANQNTNQALQNVNQNINTNQPATNQNINQQPAQQAVAAKQPESTCQSTNECIGATKIKCLKDWLTRSKCFSESYLSTHFTNFRMDQNNDKVLFNFVFDDNLVLSYKGGSLGQSGYAEIDGEANNHKVLNYIGPLKEYQLSITKEEAMQKAKADATCKISDQANIMDFVYLIVKDEFDAYDYEYGNIYVKHDATGLHWNIPTTQCGLTCQVDAITGDLNKIDVGCEY